MFKQDFIEPTKRLLKSNVDPTEKIVVSDLELFMLLQLDNENDIPRYDSRLKKIEIFRI
jgi:hypothetical protein